MTFELELLVDDSVDMVVMIHGIRGVGNRQGGIKATEGNKPKS